MVTLADIRAKLKAQDEKRSNAGSSFSGSSEIYPHWNIEDGQSCRLRFIPDADASNPYFWVERQLIKLSFSGIKGDPASKPVIVQVPCIEMWPDMGACPILTEVRPWFKDKSLEVMGRKYWKKRSYLAQGFVRENPLQEDSTPENPIRRFIISPQIFALIKAALMDPEFENLPIDYVTGLDFIVAKTAKGNYADYNTSKWARKESPLSIAELEAIEKFGLFNLAGFLPKKPTKEEQDIMVEMFHASVDGEAYDPERWGKYFKPFGVQLNDDAEPVEGSDVTTKAITSQRPVAKETESSTAKAEPTDSESDKPVTGGSKAEDIIAFIRSRQKKPE
jgi:hypothetical protein